MRSGGFNGRCDFQRQHGTYHFLPEVERMFAHIARIITAGGCICLYGPLHYGGCFTSESNARFDAWLKSRNPHSGIRDFEAVNQLAASHGLQLVRDIEMPSNNRILVWESNVLCSFVRD